MALPRDVRFSNPVFVTILGAALACFDTHAFAPREAAESDPTTKPRASVVGSGGGATTEDPARDGTHAGNPSVMESANGA